MATASHASLAATKPSLPLSSGASHSTSSHALVLSWSPYEALPWLLCALACAVLITQFFEFAVIATLYRLQWHRGKTHHELCLFFYQVYWAAASALFVCALLWLYVTDRWAYKGVYGLVGFVVVQALQLSAAILLTSWKDMANSLRTQRQRPWLQKLLGASPVTQKTVAR